MNAGWKRELDSFDDLLAELSDAANSRKARLLFGCLVGGVVMGAAVWLMLSPTPAPITPTAPASDLPVPAPAAPTQQAANAPLSALQERALKPETPFGNARTAR